MHKTESRRVSLIPNNQTVTMGSIMEQELQFWWNCYWYNYYYGSHPIHLHSIAADVSSDPPPCKQRKLSHDDHPVASTPSGSALTKLKGKPASGKLGLITFRPHSDPNPLPLSRPFRSGLHAVNHQTHNKGSLVSVHPCNKRRFTGDHVAKPGSSANNNNKGKTGTRKIRDIIRDHEVSVLSSPNLSNEGVTTVRHLLPECLSHVFKFLDVQSKGRAAQVRTTGHHLLLECFCNVLNYLF